METANPLTLEEAVKIQHITSQDILDHHALIRRHIAKPEETTPTDVSHLLDLMGVLVMANHSLSWQQAGTLHPYKSHHWNRFANNVGSQPSLVGSVSITDSPFDSDTALASVPSHYVLGAAIYQYVMHSRQGPDMRIELQREQGYLGEGLVHAPEAFRDADYYISFTILVGGRGLLALDREDTAHNLINLGEDRKLYLHGVRDLRYMGVAARYLGAGLRVQSEAENNQVSLVFAHQEGVNPPKAL